MRVIMAILYVKTSGVTATAACQCIQTTQENIQMEKQENSQTEKQKNIQTEKQENIQTKKQENHWGFFYHIIDNPRLGDDVSYPKQENIQTEKQENIHFTGGTGGHSVT